MSPTAVAQKPASTKSKLGGKEFEETFKPKNNAAEKNVEDKKGRKGKKDKKKKSPFGRIVLILIIVIVLVGAAGAALYFSGNLNAVFEAVGLKKPEAVLSIEQREAALDQREAALQAREQSLSERESELDIQTKALEDAQSAASAAAEANRTFEEIRAGFSEEKLAELKQVGAIYSKMDPIAAAAIITEIYDDQQIAIIIYNMQAAASAQLLAKLDAGLAARVTQIMTR